MITECQSVHDMLLKPVTPLIAPISTDLGFPAQDEVCGPIQLIENYEFINYSGVNFLKINLCPRVKAYNIDTRSITKRSLEEQGLNLSGSNIKFIETQIFGEPSGEQTDLMVPLDENNEIKTVSLDGQEVILNSFALLHNFEDHGSDSEDINGCLSGGVVAALAIYGGIKSLRENGKRRRDSRRPIAIASKNGTVNLGTVGDGEKQTTIKVEMPPLGSISEKNMGNIDLMAESRKEKRERQDRNAAAWKEIDDLNRFDIVSRIEEENAQIKAQIEPGWVSYGNGLATVCEGGKPVLFIDPRHPEYGARAIVLTDKQRKDPEVKQLLKTLTPVDY